MSARWTEEDLLRHTRKRGHVVGRVVEAEPSRSKFRNVRVQVDGYTFDSKHEAQHYQELRLREKAGEISKLQVHVKFPLWTIYSGGAVQVSEYEADFVYMEGTQQVVADTKGHLTAIYKLKRKWLELQEGIIIREVYKNGKPR